MRILGSVGEPINPEAWEWFYHVVGNGNCPIMDTWWQTETGGILITPLPGVTALKPGSATLPFFGVKPEIMDNQGRIMEGTAEGILVISHSWPGQARTVYGDHQRFIDTYFKNYPGYYFAGDGARRDDEGYYWITGRVDDVINVSGHRMGTAEIESALVLHEQVAEAARLARSRGVARRGIDGEHVVAVDPEPRHAVGVGAAREVAESGVPLDRGVLREPVALEEDHRQPAHRREVQRLVEGALVDGAVAEEAERHVRGLPRKVAASAAPAARPKPPPTMPFAPSMPSEKSAMCMEPPRPAQVPVTLP